MSRDSSGSYLSAVFVDYDNIYLSLKRKSETAAKLFAKDADRWIRGVETGRLITTRNGSGGHVRRRIVMNRCYGNPVPRRNQADNSTDMNSFPFVRHHFLRGGFEIVDCPPLTAQLKNSADIRMVMDIRDFLTHDTYFDEFVLLSGDADFTPLLHRLRAHARRTVVFSNDHTAAPYSALCDGEIREADLIELLIEEMQIDDDQSHAVIEPAIDLNAIRAEIIAEVTRAVLSASAPQALEALAERSIRVLGHTKTVGTEWGGAGNFRDLLSQELPSTVNLTDQAPYFAYDVSRAIARSDQAQIAPPAAASAPAAAATPEQIPEMQEQLAPEQALSLQESIARIQQASKAPPLSPPVYRAVFSLLANELALNKMQGLQTIDNVATLATELGVEVKKEDIRFIIDVVGKDDPWFERGSSALIFAKTFRNYVLEQCVNAGMKLTADQIDLVDAWLAGGARAQQIETAAPPAPAQKPDAAAFPNLEERTERWWQETTAAGPEDGLAISGANDGSEEFPRIVRNRLKA